MSFMMMAFLSFYSMKQFSSLNNYSSQVDHTNRIITQLYKVQDILKEIDIKERGYMLTKDSVYIAELFATYHNLFPSMQLLKGLTNNNKEQYRELSLLGSAIVLRLDYFKKNLDHIDSSKSTAVSVYYAEGRRLKNECLSYINSMLNRENAMLNDRFKNKQYYQNITASNLKYLLGIFFFVTIILFLLMINELKKRIAYQDELYAKLVDLRRSHSELEQIAFAASHDLQEPLRKIKMFSDRLLWLNKDDVDEENKETVERITYATTRMQELIDDMVNLTSLIKEDGVKEPTDLNKILVAVLQDLENRIKNANGVVHQEVLPEITGYPRQFYILFKSLLDNSLKFARKNVPPVIAIRADVTNGDELVDINKDLAHKKFYRITFSDNGIGFENKFISKMFRIFQRLHSEESKYEGKGIGLAICQRIMVNHKGIIIAHGHPEVGATFKLFFPVEE